MKNPISLLITFCLCIIGTGTIQAQSFDRVAISSGGISSDTINATIGEIFVFSINSGGMSLDAGSQSNTDNTGGLITTVTKTENQKSEMLVYPNPVDDYLNIQIMGASSEILAFHVFDILGKLVMQQDSEGKNNLYRIPVSQITSGNYFIQGYTPKGETTGKIQFIKL